MNRFVTLVIFVTSSLIAQDVVYISLGRSCQTAFCLIDSEFRTVAYPFDWLISHYHSVYRALDDDFANFFTELSLNYDLTAAVDHYGLEFRNVWQYEGAPYNRELDRINWKEQIPQVTESFKRKIQRFRDACNSNQKVVFIRWEDIDLARAIELRNLITSKYPHLSFTLMVVNDREELRSLWNEENIRYFSFPYNDLEAWKKALIDVGSSN